MWPFTGPEVTVLLLCTANVCRSPAAAALLRAALRRRGLRRRVRVLSAGTAVGAPGALADPRMVAIAREVGVTLKRHRAQQVTDAMLSRATVVYAMTSEHLDACADLPGWDDGLGQLLDPAGRDVEDPYFGDKSGVRAVFERLAELCELRAEEWRQHLAELGRL